MEGYFNSPQNLDYEFIQEMFNQGSSFEPYHFKGNYHLITEEAVKKGKLRRFREDDELLVECLTSEI